MRRKARTDNNHREIKTAFERLGCSVLDLAGVGGGCPDLLIGYQRHNLLIEVKDGSKSPSRQRLNDLQVEFHTSWRGAVHTVTSVDDVIEMMNTLYWYRTAKE